MTALWRSPWASLFGVALVTLLVLLQPLDRMQAQQAPPLPTIAEAEATQPGVPPAAVPPSETLGWMFTFGIFANYVMRKMRQSQWFPWAKEGAGKINVVLAGLLAALSAAGIHTEFDQAAGTFLVTGLTLTGLLHFVGEWMRQWALQQFTYQTMKDTAS